MADTVITVSFQLETDTPVVMSPKGPFNLNKGDRLTFAVDPMPSGIEGWSVHKLGIYQCARDSEGHDHRGACVGWWGDGYGILWNHFSIYNKLLQSDDGTGDRDKSQTENTDRVNAAPADSVVLYQAGFCEQDETSDFYLKDVEPEHDHDEPYHFTMWISLLDKASGKSTIYEVDPEMVNKPGKPK